MQQHFYALRNALTAMIVLMLVCTTAILRGQTLYIGPDNGDWLTAANWNAGLPSATNAPTVSGGKIVCINGSLTIDYAVQNFGTIINKGTTTVSTGSILSGGALENQGTLTVSSAFIFIYSIASPIRFNNCSFKLFTDIYSFVGAAAINNNNITDNRLQTLQCVGNNMCLILSNDNNRDIHSAKKQ